MKRFEVWLYKPVSDVLRARVSVEAETPEAAEAAALALDMEEIEFDFWQCGDNPDPITAEAIPHAVENAS